MASLGCCAEDRKIRFWNTLTGKLLQAVDTESEVTGPAWSKHAPELVSAHGYEGAGILVWQYPSLTQVAELTDRVLYLAILFSPEGATKLSCHGTFSQ